MTDAPFTLGAASNTPHQDKALMPALDVIADTTEAAPDGMWMLAELPSNGLAGYPSQIRVRKFGGPDLVRLGAARKAGSFPMVVGAIAATIQSVDVRVLTTGDFDYLMYWHSINSLAKRPLTVTWESRYGYQNKTTVEKSMRKTTYLENANDIREWQARGYDFARIGDELWRLHAIDTKTMTDELEVEFALANWVRVDNPGDFESKLAVVRGMQDLAFYEDLDEWRTIAYHGVKDVTTLKCQHFNPEEAIDRVTRSLANIDASATFSDYDLAASMQTNSLLTELAHLRKLEANGRLSEAVAVGEEVTIPLDVTNFFPVRL